MADTLELKIVSLKEEVFHDYVDSVTLPTKDGEITVLPNHAALVSSLREGGIRVRMADKEENFPTRGGFLEVTGGSRLTVLLS